MLFERVKKGADEGEQCYPILVGIQEVFVRFQLFLQRFGALAHYQVVEARPEVCVFLYLVHVLYIHVLPTFERHLVGWVGGR